MPLLFQWNQSKAESNRKKHGVDFHEASEVFGDPLSLTIVDKTHSIGEERFVTIGQTSAGTLLVVVHLDAGDTIRIVSARRATANERKVYEQD